MADLTPVSPKPTGMKLAKVPFADTVLVCGKCARKLKGANTPGSGKPVVKQLKAELKGRDWGKVRVVETKCLDLCPKRRQVVASARTLADHRLLVLEAGFSPREALTALLGPPKAVEPVAEEALSFPG